MIRDILINGRTAKLATQNGTLRYEREGGESTEAMYSIEAVAPGTYSVVIGTASFRVTVGRAGEFLVNGQALTVEAFDPRERRASAGSGGVHGSARVAAPMPGKVIRVLVAVDQEIKEGQGLVVVEAMKMQNEMKSPMAGRVTEVRVQAGATVAAGEVLVVIE